jgi:GTPase SAR1 family protein
MIIAFDLTNAESFENVKTWMNSIYKHSDPSISKVLVGNKIDLDSERVVSTSEGQKIAKEHGMDYFEVSAKENINIQEVMTYIMDKVFNNLYAGNKDAEENDRAKPSIVLGPNNSNANKNGSDSKQGVFGSDCKCSK